MINISQHEAFEALSAELNHRVTSDSPVLEDIIDALEKIRKTFEALALDQKSDEEYMSYPKSPDEGFEDGSLRGSEVEERKDDFGARETLEDQRERDDVDEDDMLSISNCLMEDLDGKPNTLLSYLMDEDNGISLEDKKELLQYAKKIGLHPRTVDEDGWSSFHVLARDGQADLLRECLALWSPSREEINLITLDDGESSALMLALRWASRGSQRFETIQLLLEAGADVQSQDEDGNSPFSQSSMIECHSLEEELEKIKIVKEMIRLGALDEENFENSDLQMIKDEALLMAAKNITGDVGMQFFNFLIELGADVHTKGGMQESVLHEAVLRGSLSNLQKIIDLGVDIDHANSRKETTVMKAAQRNRKDVVKFLIEKGANRYFVDVRGQGPLHWAVDHMPSAYPPGALNPNKVTSTNQDKSQEDILKEEHLKWLCSKMDPMHETGTASFSPWGMACANKTPSTLQIMIDGAAEGGIKFDVKQRGPKGDDGLMMAARRGQVETVDFLLKKYKPEALQNQAGEDLVLLAARAKSLPILKKVWPYRSKQVARSDRGHNALHYAVVNDDASMAEFLLAHGFDASQQSNDGDTPLDLAITMDRESCIMPLIQHGALINVEKLNDVSDSSKAKKIALQIKLSLDEQQELSALTQLHTVNSPGSHQGIRSPSNQAESKKRL